MFENGYVQTLENARVRSSCNLLYLKNQASEPFLLLWINFIIPPFKPGIFGGRGFASGGKFWLASGVHISAVFGAQG